MGRPLPVTFYVSRFQMVYAWLCSADHTESHCSTHRLPVVRLNFDHSVGKKRRAIYGRHSPKRRIRMSTNFIA